MDYNSYQIPTNFTDSGKLFGIFEIRNAIEAAIISVPLLYFPFVLIPAELTWKIIFSLTFAVPVGGFALIGINDDCLSRFVKIYWNWFKNRKILLYRGDAENGF